VSADCLDTREAILARIEQICRDIGFAVYRMLDRLPEEGDRAMVHLIDGDEDIVTSPEKTYAARAPATFRMRPMLDLVTEKTDGQQGTLINRHRLRLIAALVHDAELTGLTAPGAAGQPSGARYIGLKTSSERGEAFSNRQRHKEAHRWLKNSNCWAIPRNLPTSILKELMARA
jgi:hypothetical protein